MGATVVGITAVVVIWVVGISKWDQRGRGGMSFGSRGVLRRSGERKEE